jgi:hypothetical protein
MIEVTTAWFVVMFSYAVIGAFLIGSWIGKIIFASIDYVSAKKKLNALENKIRLAELKAREIQAGL